MNRQLILSLTHLSIERSLEQYLLQNLSAGITINSLSFYSVQSQSGIIYQCPVSIKLAKGNLNKAQAINHQIISSLIFKPVFTEHQVSLKFEVTFTESGLLKLSLDYNEINQWLQRLPKLFLSYYSLSLLNQQPIDINDEFFVLQYAHARCCSLLRSGHLDHLIQLKTLDFYQLAWFWLSPDLILDNQLIWQQTEERELIHQIIKVIDGLDRINSMKLASDLSHAFLKFEQSCRIWGEVKHQSRTLAQSRLGLIAIAQLLLRFLLTEKLGLIPFMQL